MIEPAAEGATSLRAYLRVGGLSVARQQLGLALALRCERIVCIAAGLDPELVALQHQAEQSGAQFNVIGGARHLVGLVTAIDDVIVLGDGLFASTLEAVGLIEKGQGVLVQPIERGLAAGFERIDINHASAAAMRIPGRLVERLAELPADVDAVSALQRIALQAGVPQRSIPATGSEGSFWTLVRSEADAHALEPLWIRHRTRSAGTLTPGEGLALLGVRALGPSLLHAGSGATVAIVTAAVLALFGLGAGWLGFAPLGMAFLGLGWILRRAGSLLVRIENDTEDTSRTMQLRLSVYGWLLDLMIVEVTTWSLPAGPGLPAASPYFAPIVLIALLRIVPRATGGRWSAWLEDRSLLVVLLVSSMLAGVTGEAIQLAALLLAIAGIAVPRGELRITRP